jgi:translation initiation factor RLI1
LRCGVWVACAPFVRNLGTGRAPQPLKQCGCNSRVVARPGKLCIEVGPTSKLAWISEELCIGCGICVKVRPALARRLCAAT